MAPWYNCLQNGGGGAVVDSRLTFYKKYFANSVDSTEFIRRKNSIDYNSSCF